MNQAAVVDSHGYASTVHVVDSRLVLRAARPQPRAPQSRPDMLPDGEVARGGGTIRAAWLTGPTTRYDHGVLGDAVEAAGLAVETPGGRILALTLGPESVFEDQVPRLVDMTGAGDDQVLLVRSYLNRGAALALVAVEGESLSIVAESPSIGRAFRWLNPVGVADFDGDGDREAAAVITPHIGGLLTLFRRDGHRLAPVAQARGFSNHAIGSRELGLSAILDANADGVADMAIPDARRSTLRVVSFAGGRFADLARIPHRSAVATAILAVDLNGDGRPDLIYGLADSTLVAVLFDG